MSNQSYTALTSAAGFVELDDWSCLEVTGADRAKFLQNMCTNDVQCLQPGQGCEAFFTDVKGHVLAHVLVTNRERSLFLIRSTPEMAELITHLERYIIRENVQLHDRTSELLYLLVAGQDLQQEVEEIIGNTQLTAELTAPLSSSSIGIGGVPCELLRFPVTHAAWLIECPRNASVKVGDQFNAKGVERCDGEAWEALRIEAGFPLDRVDITERNLPQEIGRNEQAINFNKGCYLGQETVARIDALGHVNQTLVSVRFTGERVPPRDTPLTSDGKDIGRVTSACYSPRENAPLALAYVRRGLNAPGKQLESDFGPAEVIVNQSAAGR